MILDLGCGIAKVKEAIGVDKIPLVGVDVIADLEHFPYPFKDNTFDTVYLNDVIEHIPNTIAVMEEVFRISKNNARIFIRVVNWNSHYTAMDPTHVKAFTENSFDFFGKRKGRSYYTKAQFDVVKVDYQYNANAQNFLKSKTLMKFLSDYLSNILEGLEFELKTVKPNIVNDQTKYTKHFNLYDILECPNCALHNNDTLKLYKNAWLICNNPSCKQKYPIYKKLPIMLDNEGKKRKKISLKKLTIPPICNFDIIKVDK